MSLVTATQGTDNGLDLEVWLRPVSDANPTGTSLRYQPLYAEVSYAREEENPNLPMGQWARSLKTADWKSIELSCTQALQTKSKDFQLVAWLTEAWLRTSGFEGLRNGLALTHAVATQYWQDSFPVIEEGDADARIGVFEWMNDTFAAALNIHVPLFRLVDHKPPVITLAQWDEVVRDELSTAASDATGDTEGDLPPLFTRAGVLKNVKRHSSPDLARMLSMVRECRASLRELDSLIFTHLGSDSPSWQKLSKVLEDIEFVYAAINPDTPPTLQDKSSQDLGLSPLPNPAKPESNDMDDELEAGAQLAPGTWSNRDQAYKTLEQVAEYLATIEPHSPTPYLIRRAVKWGKLPLAELIQEVLNEEGDINGMLAMMGLQR